MGSCLFEGLGGGMNTNNSCGTCLHAGIKSVPHLLLSSIYCQKIKLFFFFVFFNFCSPSYKDPSFSFF